MRLLISILFCLIYRGVSGYGVERLFCSRPGRHENPRDNTCASFYQCSLTLFGDLVQTLYHCPEGSLFSSEELRCVRGYRCKKPRVSYTTDVEQGYNVHYRCNDGPNDSFQCRSSGKQADLDGPDCSRYHLCSLTSRGYYVRKQLQCPSGTLFDPKLQQCHSGYSCPCDKTTGYPVKNITIDPCIISTDKKQFICTTEGNFADIKDVTCIDYFTCTKEWNGGFIKTRRSCHHGAFFDPKLKRCTENYECPCQIARHSTPPPTRSWSIQQSSTTKDLSDLSTPLICTPPSGGFKCAKEGRFPDRSDVSCSSYFLCHQGKDGRFEQKRYRCPRCLTFNPASEQCTDNYVCPCSFTEAPKTLTTKLSTATSTIPIDCTIPLKPFACLTTGRFADRRDTKCLSYFECVRQPNGRLLSQRYVCQAGFKFNSAKQRCEPNYKCPCSSVTTSTQEPSSKSTTTSKRSTTSQQDCTPGNTPFICRTKGRFADKNDGTCTSYFLCSQLRSGKILKTAYKCPANSKFDPQLGKCSSSFVCPCATTSRATKISPTSSQPEKSSTTEAQTPSGSGSTKSNTGTQSASTKKTASSSSSKATKSTKNSSKPTISTVNIGSTISAATKNSSPKSTETPTSRSKSTSTKSNTAEISTTRSTQKSTGSTKVSGTTSEGKTPGTTKNSTEATKNSSETSIPTANTKIWTVSSNEPTLSTKLPSSTVDCSISKEPFRCTTKGRYPNNQDNTCGTYYLCSNVKGKLHQTKYRCSRGLKFNPSAGRCSRDYVCPVCEQTISTTEITETESTDESTKLSTVEGTTKASSEKPGSGSPKTSATNTPGGSTSTKKTSSQSPKSTEEPTSGSKLTTTESNTEEETTVSSTISSHTRKSSSSTKESGTTREDKTPSDTTTRSTKSSSSANTKISTVSRSKPTFSTNLPSSTVDCSIPKEPFRCTATGRYPNKQDNTCSTYYLCSKLKGKLHQTKYRCSRGLRFNPGAGRCSRDYVCPVCEQTTSTTEITETEITDESTKPSTVEGKTKTSSEKPGSGSPKISTTKQLTSSRSTLTTTSTTPSPDCIPPKKPFKCTKPGHFPDKTDSRCLKYFLCKKLPKGIFIREEFECPIGKFDPEAGKCRLFYKCPCETVTTTSASTKTTNKSSQSSKSTETPTTRYRSTTIESNTEEKTTVSSTNSSNTRKASSSTKKSGTTIERKTPSGTTKISTSSSTANTKIRTVSSSKPTLSTNLPSSPVDCSIPKEPFICKAKGRYPNKQDNTCGTYYLCSEVKGKLHQTKYRCSRGSKFNPSAGRCSRDYMCPICEQTTSTTEITESDSSYESTKLSTVEGKTKTSSGKPGSELPKTSTREEPISSSSIPTKRPNTPSPDCIPPKTPFKCAKPGHFPDKTDSSCVKYFFCKKLVDGVLVREPFECLVGKFNPERGKCSLFYKCPCETVTTVSTTPASTKTTKNSSQSPKSTEKLTSRYKSTTTESDTAEISTVSSHTRGSTGSTKISGTTGEGTTKNSTESTKNSSKSSISTVNTKIGTVTSSQPSLSTELPSSPVDCSVPTEPFQCTTRGRYPNKQDDTCGTYFLCSKVKGKLRQTRYRCKRGLKFNPGAGRCSRDYACPVCKQTTSITEITETDQSTKLSTVAGKTKSTSEKPRSGSPNTSSTKEATPSKSPATGRGSTPSPDCIPPKKPFECTNAGRFPDKTDSNCVKYFLCQKLSSGVFIREEFKCIIGKFDPEIGKCTLSYKCPCGISTTASSASTSTNSPSSKGHTKSRIGSSTADKTQSSTRNSEGSSTKASETPSHTRKSTGSTQQSIPSKPSESSSGTTSKTETRSSTERTSSPSSSGDCSIPKEPFRCTSRGRFPNKQDVSCSTYYLCTELYGNLHRSQYTCPDGSKFDPQLGRCTLGYVCPCTKEASTTTKKATTQPSKCEASPINREHTCTTRGRFKSTRDLSCTRYILCASLKNGTFASKQYSCPRFSYFDPSLGICSTKYKCPCKDGSSTTRSSEIITKIPGTRAPWRFLLKHSTTD